MATTIDFSQKKLNPSEEDKILVYRDASNYGYETIGDIEEICKNYIDSQLGDILSVKY